MPTSIFVVTLIYKFKRLFLIANGQMLSKMAENYRNF